MPIAILYARFSPRPNAKECDSIEKQVERCVNYAGTKGYDVFGSSFFDKETSGGVLDRPGLSDAIGTMKAYEEPILVVDSPDRLARDVLVFLTIQQQVIDAGGRIEYADGSPNSTTPEGELLINILACFAQFERSRIRHRTKRGLARKKAQGQWLGRPPIGFQLDRDTKRLVENREERKAVIHAKILRDKLGYTQDQITEEVQRVFGDYRGKPWKKRTIRTALSTCHEWESDFGPDGESELPI